MNIVLASHLRASQSERAERSRKTVSFEEQIMSRDKYLSIFSPEMEAIVFIVLHKLFATHAVLKVGE